MAFGVGAASGVADHIIAYNHEAQEYSLIADDLALECLFIGASLGYTEEGLAALYTNWEDVPGSADDAQWRGGAVYLGAFNSAHKLGAFSGATLAARLETGELAREGNRRFRTTGVRFLIEADSALASGDVTVSIGYRDKPDGAVTYTTGTAIALNGIAPQLTSAKFQRARFDIAAGVDWEHAVGAEYELVDEGRF
jgi:hypothetical protein